MSSVDVLFARALLRQAHELVKLNHPEINLVTGAWVYHFIRDSWEFHGLDKFYWNGSAGNAYEARYKGWMAWLRSKGLEQ